MSDERQPSGGGADDRDMFDSLGLKAEPAASPNANSPAHSPPPPPPGAGAQVSPLGRMRPRAQTLLGIPDPAGAKPILGQIRPSAQLRAAAAAEASAAAPPPPPRRASLPEIDASAPVLPEAVTPPEPDMLRGGEERVVDDAAETHVYPKQSEESAQQLLVTADAATEHASIDDILAAKPVPPPVSEEPVTTRADPSAARLAAALPSGPRLPVSASRLPVSPASGPLSGRPTPLAPQAVPAPPAPPPPAAKPRSLTKVASAPPKAGGTAPVTVSVAGPPPHRPTQTTKRKRKNKSSSLAFLLIAVMAGAAAVAFLLMPRSSTLVVNVADAKGSALTRADVFVDGNKRCDDVPCVVRDLSVGNHDVRVAAAGFESPPSRAINVDGRRDVLADFQLAPAKGTGFRVTGGTGIKLSVDGKDVGMLPQEKRDLEPGEHKLHFGGDRYEALDKTIKIVTGEVLDLGGVPLKVSKGRAVLQLGTPGAKVYLVSDDTRKEVPQLPMAIEFNPAEKWQLVATKDQYEDFSEPIRFDDGQADKTIIITLVPKAMAGGSTSGGSTPTPSPQPPADRQASNTTPPPRPQPAPPRPQPVPAKPDTDDESSSGSAASAAGETVLKINSLPASSVVLDGKTIGSTPLPHVVVAPGSHTVTFINSELSVKKTITVDVKAGESKAAFAKLRE